jgi:hypothetical protein
VALLLALYIAASGVPDLKSPVQVVDASFTADGGSFHIVVQDSDSRQFAVGASGSLEKGRIEFPLYTQRWWPSFPLPTIVRRGSSSEKELGRSVQRWIQDTQGNEQAQTALRPLAAILQERAQRKPE